MDIKKRINGLEKEIEKSKFNAIKNIKNCNYSLAVEYIMKAESANRNLNLIYILIGENEIKEQNNG